MTKERNSMLAAIAANCIFGLSYLFSKMSLDIVEPLILLSFRFLITFVLMTLLILFRMVKVNLKNKKLLLPILIGVLQPVLYFILENYGLKYTTTSFTGIISSISPIFTAILGIIFLREFPSKKQWICILISILGVGLISLGTSSGENTWAGCLCLFGAYLAGSLYTILIRKISKEYTPFELTYVMFTVGVIFFVALAFFQHGSDTVPMLGAALQHKEFIISALYLGGASSVGAFLLLNYALTGLPVTRTAAFSSISTIVSVLSGVLFMGDDFTWISILAFVLILAGVTGVNRFAQKEAAR